MNFGIDRIVAAVVAIDLHRGHLDDEVATMPLSPGVAAQLIAANRDFNNSARAEGIPIVHLVTSYRDATEIRSNPFWRARADDPQDKRRNVERHNLESSPGIHIIAELCDTERDWIVRGKKRYDGFLGTDLEFFLRTHGINTVLITGVNTNSCVLATAATAGNRDYVAIVIEDCVQTMDGPELHDAGLRCIETAFGWVMDGQQALAAVAE